MRIDKIIDIMMDIFLLISACAVIFTIIICIRVRNIDIQRDRQIADYFVKNLSSEDISFVNKLCGDSQDCRKETILLINGIQTQRIRGEANKIRYLINGVELFRE